jgi:hypothetical protein
MRRPRCAGGDRWIVGADHRMACIGLAVPWRSGGMHVRRSRCRLVAIGEPMMLVADRSDAGERRGGSDARPGGDSRSSRGAGARRAGASRDFRCYSLATRWCGSAVRARRNDGISAPSLRLAGASRRRGGASQRFTRSGQRRVLHSPRRVGACRIISLARAATACAWPAKSGARVSVTAIGVRRRETPRARAACPSRTRTSIGRDRA